MTMPLEVIGAGAGRTGTTSLKLALDQLGFGPCCHMSELFKSENRWRWALWERAFDDEPVDWEEVFKGYRSAVDSPTNYYWRELTSAYPNAKVILTIRDPESWYRSVMATVGSSELRAQQTANPESARLLAKAEAAQIKRGARPADDYPADPEQRRYRMIAHFNHWIDEVKRSLPPERLLVFDVKQGWAPLCKFLNTPVPDTPFPRENSTEAFQARIRAATPSQ